MILNIVAFGVGLVAGVIVGVVLCEKEIVTMEDLRAAADKLRARGKSLSGQTKSELKI
jgi:hypothetical protein